MQRDDDAEILATARLGFLDEAADMLQQFEQALLVMESTPDDAENLNAAVRAAHTIKGTAGMFGCDAVVLFTHEVETLMEFLRSGKLAVTDDISTALLDGLDQMSVLLDEVHTGEASPAVQQRSVALGQRLRALHGAAPTTTPATAAAAAAPAATTTATAPAAAGASAACWHLSLRFGGDALRNGLDPLAFIRYLGSLGTVHACHTLAGAVPALAELDAEDCHLGFELRLHSSATADDIERVFEFAADDCSLRILPPQATAADFAALLQLRCADDSAAAAHLAAVWTAQGAAQGAGAAHTAASLIETLHDDPDLLPETAAVMVVSATPTAATTPTKTSDRRAPRARPPQPA